MTTYLTVIPAYGRDYKSQKAVLEDWNADKDFVVATLGHRGYINKADAPKGYRIMVRYDRLRKVVQVQ